MSFNEIYISVDQPFIYMEKNNKYRLCHIPRFLPGDTLWLINHLYYFEGAAPSRSKNHLCLRGKGVSFGAVIAYLQIVPKSGCRQYASN